MTDRQRSPSDRRQDIDISRREAEAVIDQAAADWIDGLFDLHLDTLETDAAVVGYRIGETDRAITRTAA